MNSTSKAFRQSPVKNWMTYLTALSVLAIATVANAAFIGHDPTGPWSDTSDGVEVLALQINNPVAAAATVDSFSFFQGNTTSTRFAALIVRPTSTNHYSVIYNSGIIDLTQPPFNAATGVKTVSIAPVAVQVGDLVASFGTGISFQSGTVSVNDRGYWQGQGFGTMTLPTTAFTTLGAPDSSDPNYTGLTSNRIYALSFHIAEVPEPTSATIAILGMVGLCRIVRKRR